MRIYDPRIGKFLSVDPLTSKYPELTPYQFASNTPIQAIDLDGLEAFFVHGTTNFDVGGKNFGIAAYKFKGNSDLVNGIASTFGNTTKDVGFSWSGNNSNEARKLGGIQFAMYILKNRKPGEPITLVGHSHGGNVAIEAINYLVTEKLVNPADINLITLNTPDRQEQTLPENSPVDFFSINANGDQIQEIGSNGFDGNGIFPDNFDKQIMFEDQNGGALDFSNHAQSDKNYATFGPMLKQAKRELDASKKPQEYIPPAAQSYQSTPSQPQ